MANRRPAFSSGLTALLLLVVYAVSVTAQRNVTILDEDPRITFSPLCSPRTTQCNGGWWSSSFGATDRRTITYGPAGTNIPSASFQFTGTAIYYYAVTSAKTASVTIQLDSDPSTLVNLTQTLGLVNNPVEYPILAWKREGLNPSVVHTFYLQWAENGPDAVGKWAGFDNIQYTEPQSLSSLTSLGQIGGSPTTSLPKTTESSSVGKPETKETSNAGVIGGAVGGVMAGIIIIILAIIVWKKKKLKEQNAIDMRERQWDPENRPGGHGSPAAQPMLGVPTPYILPGSSSSNPYLSAATSDVSNSQTSSSGKTPMMIPALPQLRPGDENNPDAVALVLHQQRMILDMLAQQQAESAGSSSGRGRSRSQSSQNPPGAPWLADFKQSSPKASPPLLPPGAAEPVIRTPSPATTAITQHAPPAYPG